MSWFSLIPAGASLLGGLMGHSAQSKANKANIALARENRNWEERMSNTAWQRGAEDMKKAGFNPMLAFSQGGASTPQHSAPTVQPEDALSRGVASAGDKMGQMLTLENMKLQNQILGEKREQEIVTTHRMQAENPVGEKGTGHYNLEKLTSETRAALAKADLAELERKLVQDTLGFNVNSARARSEAQQQEVTMNEIRMRLMNLEFPEKQAMAKWFETVGAGSPAAKAVMTIGQWLKFILGR